MANIINTLRAKSEEEKKKWVVTLSLITTGLVVLVWLIVRFVFISPEPRVMINPNIKDQADFIFNTSIEQFGNLATPADTTNTAEDDFENFEDYESMDDEVSYERRIDNEVFFDNTVSTPVTNDDAPMPEGTNFFNQ